MDEVNEYVMEVFQAEPVSRLARLFCVKSFFPVELYRILFVYIQSAPASNLENEAQYVMVHHYTIRLLQ